MAFPPLANNKMGGPPPGGTPQGLTSMMPGRDSMVEPSPEPTPSGGEGGLKDIYDEIVGVLQSLAEILPEQAEEIDQISSQLAEVLAKAISGGASFKGRTQEGENIRPNPGLPV